MRILVVINQVLDPAGIAVSRRAQRLFINREEYVINPADLSALEAALQLKDESGAQVVVLSAGPERVTDAVGQALSIGADRGIRVDLPGEDPAGRVTITAAAAQKLVPFDLLLTGDRVWDSDGAQIGPRVAEALDLPQLISVDAVSCTDGKVNAIQAVRGGFRQIEAPLPALVTLPPHVNRPRYGTAARIMQVYRDPEAVERWTADDLGLTAEELAPRTAAAARTFPEPRELGAPMEGSSDEMAEQLAAVLRARAGG